ncbi:MAG TPA: ATP-binding protein [Vicinamibacterales bacterium]|jgi:signal transduction histidine kinase|nr:ATP-binding protein [Vicinamibacterales bacterium]
MAQHLARQHRRPPASITRRDLVPDLGVAAGSVALTAAVHWTLLPWLNGKPPLVLFAVMAGALTAWRGFGPGILASSLGTAVGSLLYIQPFTAPSARTGSLPIESALLFSGSLVICWLIYRVKVEQEKVEAVQGRRNDALAFVSHELRQPLATVHLAASMLERDGSPESRDRATKLILSSAARLGKFIEDLIDVTRLQGGGLRVITTPVRLQDPILSAVHLAGPAIASRQQHLGVDIPLDLPLWMSGDPVRLQQVFANLLSNACRYSPEGAEISISLRRQDGRALVVVRDTGVGISRDMLDRIFDPFVREFDGTAEGLGIGLTLARSLVMQHGGHISAQSDGPGRGSQFVIDLPLLAEHELSSTETATTTQASV